MFKTVVAGTTGSNEKENHMNLRFFLDMRWLEENIAKVRVQGLTD